MRILGLGGNIDIGYAVGFENMGVQIPSDRKSVLPRHLGVLGTTGGGKSTTVSGQIYQYQKAGLFTLVIDTEGEYTHINEPSEDNNMIRLLDRMGRKPEGVKDIFVLHLVGRDTRAAATVPIREFSLEFSKLSPYAVAEILDLNDPQLDRFFKAYDVTKQVLQDLGIFPQRDNKNEENLLIELNEFETGYPRMTIMYLIDIASFLLASVAKSVYDPRTPQFQDEKARSRIEARVHAVSTSHETSWKALLGKLWRLQRMNVFDNADGKPIRFNEIIAPGRTAIVDLSDSDSTIINNLVISYILRGIQQAQETAYEQAAREGKSPTPIMIIIEEAHEFLSRERISKMQNLYEQVARIARRGRKRWVGLMFVTQLPQHLPDEVLGLINNYILHKITDVNVISRLKRSIGGIDEGLWNRLPNLAPGQAIVAMTSMQRPILTAINPTPCKLLMID